MIMNLTYTKIKVSEVDWFFMSYGEPNADRHWQDLFSKVPWAKRIDGIKGFDAVHRACGNASNTEWLVTIDADTKIDPRFLELEATFYPNGAKNYCWASRNIVNGLVYGNGGIKLWHKPFIQKMAFHELGSGMDFCWDRDYQSLKDVYSTVYINGSSIQAFRAGYREGVKLTSDRGKVVKPENWSKLDKNNIRNLRIWATIGLGIEHGEEAILGARAGMADKINGLVKEEDIINFDFIDARLRDIANQYSASEAILKLGDVINQRSSLYLPTFTLEQTSFLREIYVGS